MYKRNYDTFLITGGTGGHVFPALSFADYLKSNGITCLIVSDKRGLNYINQEKYNTKIISSSHLNKKGVSLLAGILSLLLGLIQFNILLLREKPSKIIAFGSYTSFIPILCTIFFKKILNIKIFLHEQNSIIGRVNNLFLFISDSIFTTFKNTKGINNRYIKKAIHAGFPIRQDLVKYYKANFKLSPKNEKINLLVFGGSQGSSDLATSTINLLSKLSTTYLNKLKLTIQVPKKDLVNLELKLKEMKVEYEINIFYKDIIGRISKSNLIICRSGSATINELIELKVPSILVPLPSASKNHQYHNAKFLSNIQGAILVEQKDYLTEKTLKIIENIILNSNKLKSMHINLNKIANHQMMSFLQQCTFLA